MAEVPASYARLREGTVAWTAEATDSLFVDVDADGRPLGVEVLGEGDWRDALTALALAGRLRVTRKTPLD